MNSEINELITKIAAEDVKLLQLISSLPKIDCNNFNFHNWISKVKNIHSYIQEHKTATNIYYDDYLDLKKRYIISCVQYLHHHGPNKWRILLYSNTSKYLSNQFMSELITTCKNKNIKELLNFI